MNLEAYKPSFQQARLWPWQVGSAAFRAQCAVFLEGDLDPEKFQEAVRSVVERHEILFTTYHLPADLASPVQMLNEDLSPEWTVLDWSDGDARGVEARLEKFCCEEGRRRFELDRGPTLRLGLIRLSSRKHFVVVTLPAISADAWTLMRFIREAGQAYAGDAADDAESNRSMQYADFAQWQSDLFEAANDGADAGRAHWRRQAAAPVSTLSLPFESRPAGQPALEPGVFNSLDTLVTQEIEAAAGRYDVSAEEFLLACWNVLLWRISEQSDLVLGVQFHGRQFEELRGALGLFAKTLPVRFRLNDDLRFSAIVRHVSGALQDAHQWQDHFVWEPGAAPDAAASSSADWPIAFEFEQRNFPARFGDITVSLERQHVWLERFRLKLLCVDTGHALKLEWFYSTDSFHLRDIKILARQLVELVRAAMENPEASIRALLVLNADGLEHPRAGLEPVPDENSRAKCIHHRFEEQAKRTPDKVAIAYEGRQLTFAQLNAVANRVAGELMALGAGPDVPVAICAERSLEMMIGVLGILKAGGAYVPLDPALPQERLALLLEEVRVPILLTQPGVEPVVTPGVFHVVQLDSTLPVDPCPASANPTTGVGPGNLAYVLFTSGSTGKPKGVAVEHRQIVNYLDSIVDHIDLPAGASYATVSTFAADLGNTVIFPALCTGGCLHILSRETISDAARFEDYFRSCAIDCLKIVPSHLKTLLKSTRSADVLPRQRLVLGGEASDWNLIDSIQMLMPQCRILNHYGPTETTVGVAACRLEKNGANRFSVKPPIGRPLSRTQIYLLDAEGRAVPVWVPGELHIGGANVARGYLNQPDVTAERFVPDPFSGRPGERLYRTGDRGRYLSDGNIEWLGRVDHQVKVRGFRIELGEVEAALVRHPAVGQAVVVVREEGEGDRGLAAYFVRAAQAALLVEDLKGYCRLQLPDHAVPAIFVELESLPLTPNGKVDRSALPAPPRPAGSGEANRSAPRTPVEEIMKGIWVEALKNDSPGILDNFFELGGHSLLATQVISRVRESFGVELPLTDLFDFPTIAGLSGKVDEARFAGRGRQAPPIAPRPPGSNVIPLSFAQERLWFIHQLQPDAPAYNLRGDLRIGGVLPVEVFERVIDEIVRRHEVLRTTYEPSQDGPVQVVHEHRRRDLPVVDLEALAEETRTKEAARVMKQEAARPFDLAQGPILRTGFLRLGPEDQVIHYTLHHIASDGWARGVLNREIGTLYKAFSRGHASPLPELPVQYADFAAWQRNWLSGEELDRQMQYWKEQLRGMSPLQLPTDRPRPVMQRFRGAAEEVRIRPEVVAGLKTLSQREGVTLFMTLLAGLQVLLSRYSGQEDVAIGSVIANRNRIEIEGLIGFFVNTLVLRADLRSDPTVVEFLRQVRATTLGAYAHQDLPFEKLVEELQPDRDLSRNPLVQVSMEFSNTPEQRVELRDMKLQRIDGAEITTRWDLELHFREQKDGLRGWMIYDLDLFSEETIRRMVGHLERVLEGFAQDGTRRLSELSVLTEAERTRMVVEWNRTETEYPQAKCAHELFEQQVERSPEAAAVECEGRSLTYRELDRRANVIARWLRALGVGPEVVVGLYAERSIEMLIGLLGILKSGGAYVPLDPAYPPERLAFMLEDAAIPVLLAQRNLEEKLPAHASQLVFLEETDAWTGPGADQRIASGVTGSNLAYVIYTSGSTGRPKGVMIEQRGLVNYLSWALKTYRVSEGVGSVVHSSISFDLTITGLFLPLLAGKRVRLLREGSRLEMLASREGWSLLKLTPAHLEVLKGMVSSHDAAGCARAFVIGGEALMGEALGHWQRHAPETRLINEYGPTETVVGCCVYELGKQEQIQGPVPIGRPIANTQLYVLDKGFEPQPVGVAGELHIGGAGVARGYLNHPELTALRFVPDRFGSAGGRLYKTGDLVRHLAGGELEFLGRLDQQVKIRGYRIELGEVESVLRQQPNVKESVAMVREDVAGDQRLVAYIVPRRFQEKEGTVTQVAEWRSVFDDHLYGELADPPDPALNFAGWDSSYTDSGIPAEEMLEWLDDALQRIRALKPQRMLEIGCGTGLILFGLARQCEEYWGTDFSPRALNYLRRQMGRVELGPGRVKLLTGEAGDFTGLQGEQFHGVILNSVVQYFPDVEYLLRVLEEAVSRVAEGGFIFLGDIRSLPLAGAFHASVQLAKAGETMPVTQVRQRVQQQQAREKELMIEPGFFLALKERLPRLREVEVTLKRGRGRNELMLFRYQVVLHVGGRQKPVAEKWLEWGGQEGSVELVTQLLGGGTVESLGISNVPNARLSVVLEAVRLLEEADGTTTAGDLRRDLRAAGNEGIDPETWQELAKKSGYEVEFSWAQHGLEGRYEVIFWKGEPRGFAPRRVTMKPWADYANHPLYGRLAQRLVSQLKNSLAGRLPKYMVPSAIVALEQLPLTTNGKVDRQVLPPPEQVRPEVGGEFVGPRTEIEKALADIWSGVLGVDRVGIRDDFFELGGHSLLATQVVSRIQETYGVELPLRNIFEKPTVAGIAEMVAWVLKERKVAGSSGGAQEEGAI